MAFAEFTAPQPLRTIGRPRRGKSFGVNNEVASWSAPLGPSRGLSRCAAPNEQRCGDEANLSQCRYSHHRINVSAPSYGRSIDFSLCAQLANKKPGHRLKSMLLREVLPSKVFYFRSMLTGPLTVDKRTTGFESPN